MLQSLHGKINQVDIDQEMKSSFMDYAMSVIVARALPDVKDGLKPVHRRILYAMYDMGMFPGKPFKKCARIVGEVLGKYHPHGDTAVYDTLVRMAQDFSMRYELIDGHGNFGSIDGDSAAAMRYTEARLSSIAAEMLRDIDKETVDFGPNFDETLKEPKVLPSRFPNLLVNGSSGIAVGMATNIPPHNLREIIDGVILMIDNPEATVKELMKIIKGPDFPTGGIIMGREGIKEAYNTGRGSVKIRGRSFIEQTKSGKNRIVINEVPFQVNKAKLIEKIAELVRDKKITEISDLRDESDRNGMRLVIELKRDAIPQVVLNNLYKHTQLESTFGVIMLVLTDGAPRILSLPQVINKYIEHQKEIITRRTKHELKKAEAKAHILEGLLIALKNLDEVIKIIRNSKLVEEAREGLIKRFVLSIEQANAILDMKLQRLTSLESEKIETEYKELLEKIKQLKEILADEKKVLKIIKDELEEIKKKYGDERRTQISASATDLDIEDLIAEEEMVITVTHSGYVKRLPVTTYKKQKRGGRGVMGMDLKENDFVEHLFITSTHDYILFFTNKGKVYRVKVHELPLGSRQSKGQAIVNILPLSSGEEITEDVRSMGIVSMGVKGISLSKDDELIGMDVAGEDVDLFIVTTNGFGKRTPIGKYPLQKRGGKGVKTIRELGKGFIARSRAVKNNYELMIVSNDGIVIRLPVDGISSMGRNTKGVKIMNIRGKDRVSALARVVINEPQADEKIETDIEEENE
ncbi:MAG: DNA gyrase subunit A [Actinobacteria bacterium]|nr:DNA gyrase subunit A [Actinomycetota bacterium]